MTANLTDWTRTHRAARNDRSDERKSTMPGRVEGKNIIVTGAGSGMGRSFALAAEPDIQPEDVSMAAIDSAVQDFTTTRCRADIVHRADIRYASCA